MIYAIEYFKVLRFSLLFGAVLFSITGCALYADQPIQASAELLGVKFKSRHPLLGERFEDAAMEPVANQINFLKQNVNSFMMVPMLRAEVLGFTDDKECSGSGCDELALRRAQIVYDWLIANGVPKSNLKAPEGHGSAMPIGNNETEEGRTRNRRVEVNIIPSIYRDY